MDIEIQSPFGKVSEQHISNIRDEIVKFWHLKTDMIRASVSFNEYPNIGSDKNSYCEIMLIFPSGKRFIHTIEDNLEKSAIEAARELGKLNYQQRIIQSKLPRNESNRMVA